ncbi:hypothetical protein [Hymenobacter chitinivorans]|uniref:Uncharacterized protein n=1 Tax=Hymenobacter chitinivorans DSM 11115 TaxID=1121954 RepID=A0A2M9BRE4_9BACT|nr:hypothetical protein [Hymenobacter chitinivorans]PJJ60498.1 hypothetical protein CLV45_1927 [Hymenobacter chitinivorans DSM 11115]
MRRPQTLLLLATGAALVSVVCIALSHGVLPRPPWTYSQPIGGWTIYPPLSALPQARPEQMGPTMEEFFAYAALWVGACLAAVVTLLLWLPGLVLVRAYASTTVQRVSPWLKALPALLLIPCAVHVVGMIHLLQKSEQETEMVQQYLQLSSTTSPDSLRVSAPADSLDDAAE